MATEPRSEEERAMSPVDDVPADDEIQPEAHAIQSRAPASALPFEGLTAPAPLAADPPAAARWLAFVSILVGGLLGGMIGYGTADVMGGSSAVIGLGALLGALLCSVGVGIVAGLTLRAMNEWHAVQHPEAEGSQAPPRIRRARGRLKR